MTRLCSLLTISLICFLAEAAHGLKCWKQVGEDLDIPGVISSASNGRRVFLGSRWHNWNYPQIRVYDITEGELQISGFFSDSGYGPSSAFGKSLAISESGQRIASVDAEGSLLLYQEGDLPELGVSNSVVTNNWTLVWMQNLNDRRNHGYISAGPFIGISGDGASTLVVRHPSSDYAVAYEYSESLQNWTKKGQNITATNITKSLVRTVSVSKDGNRVALTTERSRSYQNITCYARVVEWNGTKWAIIGNDIPTGVDYQYTGWDPDPISMSADGSRVAIGAWKAHNFTGRVRVYEWTANSSWEQVGPDINGAGYNDQFGFSLALSDDGNRVLVGAIEGYRQWHGYAQVLDFNGTDWVLSMTVKGVDIGYQAGRHVALSGDGGTAVVGFYAMTNLTRVYQFLGENEGKGDCLDEDVKGGERETGNEESTEPISTAWNQLGVDIETGWVVPRHWDYLPKDGINVAAADGPPFTIAVGQRESNNGRGEVKILAWNMSGWDLVGTPIVGNSNHSYFGTVVDLSRSGDFVVAGAPRDRYSRYSYAEGSASAFRYNGSIWNQVGQKLTNKAGFGIAVSTTGNASRVAVGNNDPNVYRGEATVFDWNGTYWVKHKEVSPTGGGASMIGDCLALSPDGAMLVASARGLGQDVNSPFDSSVRALKWNNTKDSRNRTSWLTVGNPINGEYGSSPMKRLDVSSAADATKTRVVVGSYYADNYRGEVRVYQWNKTHWNQIGEVLMGRTSCDYFGYSVSISADGNRVVIGAPQLVQMRAEILPCWKHGRMNPGYVEIYDWDGEAWNLAHSEEEIVRGRAPADEFGVSVAMADGGNLVVVAATGFDPNSVKSRAVQPNGTSYVRTLTIRPTEDEGYVLVNHPTAEATGTPSSAPPMPSTGPLKTTEPTTEDGLVLIDEGSDLQAERRRSSFTDTSAALTRNYHFLAWTLGVPLTGIFLALARAW